MKKLLLLLLGLFPLYSPAELTPETITLVYDRSLGDAYADTNVYLSGTALLLTNCVPLVTGTVTQDLTGVFVVLRIGNEQTNYTHAASTGAGRFHGTVAIPTHAQLGVPVELETTVRIQCTLTNATGTVFTYRGAKLLTVRSGLAY